MTDHVTTEGRNRLNTGCRFVPELTPGIICDKPARWFVSMPGRHRMPVCNEHVIRYQENKLDSGITRIGRERGDGRYVIEAND